MEHLGSIHQALRARTLPPTNDGQSVLAARAIPGGLVMYQTIFVSVWKCLRCHCYCALGFTMPPCPSLNSEFIIRSHRLLEYVIVEEATWQYHLDLLCLLYSVQRAESTRNALACSNVKGHVTLAGSRSYQGVPLNII